METRSISNHNSFQSYILHFTHRDSFQSYHINSYVVSVILISFHSSILLFHFNHINCILIIHSNHISYQFNHCETYKYICNHGILIFFQSSIHWFHFNQNSYILTYINSILKHIICNYGIDSFQSLIY